MLVCAGLGAAVRFSSVRQRTAGTVHDMKYQEEERLLSTKISDLALRIDGTRLAILVSGLYQELERAGISFKPASYLSDGWGCPDRVPVIGIPFYLVDSKLCDLKTALTDEPAETDAEATAILRHEAGHAFNYAHRLYDSPRWRKVFGRFSQSYTDDYRPIPFSAHFVRHSAGWYAQKHPDDDFAETFAVWLTTGSEWREKYHGTHALMKLSYVDELAHQFGRQPPLVTAGELDAPVAQMTMTLRTWFKKSRKRAHIILHPILNEDLKRLLPAKRGPLAADVLDLNRQQMIRDVHYWTGIDRAMLITLIDELSKHVRLLELRIEADQMPARTASMYVFVTTLAMNYVNTGRFVEA